MELERNIAHCELPRKRCFADKKKLTFLLINGEQDHPKAFEVFRNEMGQTRHPAADLGS